MVLCLVVKNIVMFCVLHVLFFIDVYLCIIKSYFQILYHTWVWNRGICMCVIVRPRSHMLIVLKKVIPDTTIWLCLIVTIWSSQICFSVIFILFVMIQNIWEKKLHLFTLFPITRHCFSLFLVGSKSMLALLPFKVTMTPRHWNDKCFHRAGGDLICRFCICASHFQCIVCAQ